MKYSKAKSIGDLAKNFSLPQAQSDEIIVDIFAKSIINKVFSELSLIFPAWKYNWQSDDPLNPDKILNAAKQQWTKAFIENDISTMEQISAGFKKARSSNTDFLPSCGKFISWCKPSPEDLGYPSNEKALRLCVEYRNKIKLFPDFVARPLIIELSKRVDWWLMNAATDKATQNKAIAHFNSTYMGLLNLGYKEPQINAHERLPTQQTVDAGLSKQQQQDKKDRAMSHINEIKTKLKRSK